MKYVFGAVAIVCLAATPAAAKSKSGCASDAAVKLQAAAFVAPFDQKRVAMDKKLNAMNTAMSKGNMRACNKAMAAK